MESLQLDHRIRARRIADYYGKQAQLIQAMEELGELTQAIARRMNKKTFKTDELYSEMADVYIMLEQVKYLELMNQDELEDMIDYKIDRQLDRIEEDKKCRRRW